MIKARHITLNPTPEQAVLLKEMQQEAARCWNTIVAIAKEHYAAGSGWISKHDLQKRIKNRFALHSQTVQGLTDRFAGNRKTAAENRRQGLGTNYPWREKKFVTVPFKQMAMRRSKSGSLVLSLRAGARFDTGFVPPGEINTCEILWRQGRYVLSYTAEYTTVEPLQNGLLAGGDIGEIHPIALCTEDGAGLVVSGREVRSIKRWRNKRLGVFAAALSLCTKDSRKWRKLIRAKGRMKAKAENQICNHLHHATRKAINWCEEKGVSELILGNPAGVEKNTKKHKRLSRRARQKVSQMETGRIKNYLRYKAEEAGIATCLVGERGTSKDCPECGSQNRPAGRVYRCACGFTGHRDAKAGFMMIRKKHQVPTPATFRIQHQQAVPTYRKRIKPACVDGPDVTLSSLAIAKPLSIAHSFG